jgi:hypothetical protein
LGILLNRKKKENKTQRWAGIQPAAFGHVGQRPVLLMGPHGRADRL